jgi:hypothetical protein
MQDLLHVSTLLVTAAYYIYLHVCKWKLFTFSTRQTASYGSFKCACTQNDTADSVTRDLNYTRNCTIPDQKGCNDPLEGESRDLTRRKSGLVLSSPSIIARSRSSPLIDIPY